MKKVNLAAALASFDTFWDPKIVAEVSGHQVKLTKLEGEFVWHHHDEEDEMFLVLDGELRIEFRDRVETLSPGELIVVPKGVEHRPVANGEVHVLMVEPATTLNTGNVRSERTVKRPERL